MHRRSLIQSAAAVAAGAALATAAGRAAQAEIAGPRSPPVRAPALTYAAARDGTALFYKDWGAGKPAVFVHGWALGKDRPGYLAATAPLFFGTGAGKVAASAELMRWGVALALQASPKATIDMVRAMSETDMRAEMRAIKVPTLVVHGDADQQVPIHLGGAKSASLVPGSRLLVYEGGPHGLVVTHRERLNRDILALAAG